MRKKTLLFRGSRERLGRMVKRYRGEFLENGEFEVLWQPEHYKIRHRRTFRIRCRYEKKAEGYQLAYRILPTPWSLLRMAAAAGFWIAAGFLVWDPAQPGAAIASAALGGICVLSEFWQLRDAEREFLRRFTAATQ